MCTCCLGVTSVTVETTPFGDITDRRYCSCAEGQALKREAIARQRLRVADEQKKLERLLEGKC